MGLTLVVPILIHNGIILSPLGYFVLLLFSLPILIGIWNFEQIKIEENILTKTNFAGLYSNSRSLENLKSVYKKFVDNDIPTNPFGIIRWFTKNPKYFKFSVITLEFEGGEKMRINEAKMKKEDFHRLYKKLKRITARYKSI